MAHPVATGLINRNRDPSPPWISHEGITMCNKITAYHRENRKTYTAPHTDLAMEQATIWRQIQTDSFLRPRRLRKIYLEDI